jgi:hypothetical protein
VAVPFTANTTSWIANGILNATATNVVAQSDAGADILFMPGYGGSPWILFYDSISVSSDRDATLYFGDVSGGDITYFPANTGGQIVDGTLEIGNNYSILFEGWIDTSYSGSSKYIWNKNGSTRCYVSAAGTISYDVTGGPNLTATVTTGYHKINAVCSGTTRLYIDDLLVDTDSSYTAPDIAANWFIAGSSSGTTAVLYMTSFSVNATPGDCNITGWEYGTTFQDATASNNDLTSVTFRTTSSDADVSAELAMFEPISTATVDTATASSWPSIMTEVPEQDPNMYTENTSPGVFFAPLVETFWPYSGLPNSFFWYCMAFTTIVASGILVFALFASKGYSALFIKVIIMMAVMIFWAVPGPNIYGGYVPIYFGMWCFGILVLSRSYGW